MPEQVGEAIREPIKVAPVAVISRTFPARPPWIPGIREFVRRCLAESPLTAGDNREVGEAVLRALVDAARPAGAVRVSFRIFPEHVEVDVVRSDHIARDPAADRRPALRRDSPDGLAHADGRAASFADWMRRALRRGGLTQEAAARQLGVSAKTVGRWVGGETEPRMRDLRRIREVFGDLPFP